VATVIKMLEDKEKAVKVEAIRTLALLGKKDPLVSSAIIKQTKDPLAGVKMEAADALSEMQVNAEGVIEALISLLKDGDAWVRMKAALALGRYIPNDTNHTVTKALEDRKQNDTDLGVKWAADKSLTSMAV